MRSIAAVLIFLFSIAKLVSAQTISDATQSCIDCHESIQPGIVQDWLSSRHSKTIPAEALKKSKLERRISNENIPAELANTVVGCFECHGLNTEKHQDSFEHFDYKINVVVSPNDCQTCHPVEVEQYATSTKAHAIGNLTQNSIYDLLVETTISPKTIEGDKIVQGQASHFTRRETCFGCHGTTVEVKGTKTVSAELGEVEVPDLAGWPNQGVGRINPDGSLGACTSCHPRHAFSLVDARKPYTCSQCHLEPDVPAYNVYKESKHGNIFSARGEGWNFDSVPWVISKDFKAPSCTVCHSSLITNPEGKVVAERTHNFDSRIWERIFGLIYSHPQPKHGATYQIKNADGLSLPTTFDNRHASDFLISQAEARSRQGQMEKICKSCHSTDWVQKHFEKFDNTNKETNGMVLSATQLMQRAWDKKIADNKNPFDETIELTWAQQWLFYANSIRYSSAMTGAPDYAAFKNGWWYLTKTLQEIKVKIEKK